MAQENQLLLPNNDRALKRSKKSVDLTNFRNIVPPKPPTPAVNNSTLIANNSDIGNDISMDRYKNIFSSMQPKQYNPQTTNLSTSFNNLGNISTPYGGQTKIESFHPGIDIANKFNTAIPAFVGGTVEKVVTGQGWTPNSSSYGNYIIIRDKYGNKQRYSHLSRSLVNVGQEVSPGTQIGTMGFSGSTYSLSNPNSPEAASHLDFRVKDAYNKYMNPSVYVSKYGNQ